MYNLSIANLFILNYKIWHYKNSNTTSSSNNNRQELDTMHFLFCCNNLPEPILYTHTYVEMLMTHATHYDIYFFLAFFKEFKSTYFSRPCHYTLDVIISLCYNLVMSLCHRICLHLCLYRRLYLIFSTIVDIAFFYGSDSIKIMAKGQNGMRTCESWRVKE